VGKISVIIADDLEKSYEKSPSKGMEVSVEA
jgi:hypothetical protein